MAMPIDGLDVKIGIEDSLDKARESDVSSKDTFCATPEELLREGAKTMEAHVEEYGGHTYPRFGPIMMSLFPNGMPELKDVNDWNRMGVLQMIVHKLARYCFTFEKPHHDSAHDGHPYFAILESLGYEKVMPDG